MAQQYLERPIDASRSHSGTGRKAVRIAIAVTALAIPLSGLTAPSVAQAQTSASLTSVAAGKRCHSRTVEVWPVYGDVRRASGISCRRATSELRLLTIRRGRLVPAEGNNWYWSCRPVRDYYEGSVFLCTYGRRSFRAMVGA